jgi:Ni,Fe-hydrogenase III small subunit
MAGGIQESEGHVAQRKRTTQKTHNEGEHQMTPVRPRSQSVEPLVARPPILVGDAGDRALAQAGERLRRRIDHLFKGSLHIRHVDSGSCNACESEVKMLTSPYYDLHRLGIFFTPSPRHADLLLVTGPITRAMEGPLLRTYEAMPDPRLVVGVGACACGGGIFGPSAYVRGGLEGLLPVDVYIPGCPPTPVALIYGLLLATNRVEQRVRGGIWSASTSARPASATDSISATSTADIVTNAPAGSVLG